MLEDHKRTGAYYQAIMSNRRQFKDKVVLDVGTGSGILSIFAAKAGAKKVYAVEATSVAVDARKLIKHNKVGRLETALQRWKSWQQNNVLDLCECACMYAFFVCMYVVCFACMCVDLHHACI
jgi:ribosomal protein L11 methylase PrmA